MKFGPITIKDIAKALGVSTSTVSRALRGSHEINEETKRMISEYAERFNYRPNPIAKSLKENKSKTIGVVVPEIANNFFSQAINGIDAIAYNRGYHVVISQSHESYDREVINIDHLVSRRVDGLLISVASQTNKINHFKALQDQGIPIVFFDRVPEEIITHKVTANNFKGAYQAINHLISSGRKRIAHIASAPWLSITKERLHGYKTALNDKGILFDEDYVKYCNSGGIIQLEIEEALMELLNTPVKPDAIFTASDRITSGCLTALKKFNLKIPKDIAIIGFTNLNEVELLQPALSAVKQPAFEMGQISTELLIQLIESKNPVEKFETRVLETELIIRESSFSWKQ